MIKKDNIVMQGQSHSSSFRDPAGFLFYEESKLRRQVNKDYESDYTLLMNSGLYKALVDKKYLIPHTELQQHPGIGPNAYMVIEPELISFISYPYEWSFGQLKDAAILTLQIQKLAMQKGMRLKDASAYNVQFHQGRAIFIDTLSFEKNPKASPWPAYKQFCQHFLSPLALMSYTDIRLNQLLKLYIDGIPLDLASRLLPFKTRFYFPMLTHIHLHASFQSKYEHKGTAAKEVQISKSNMVAMIDNLISTVKNLKIKQQKTEWGDYYSFTNYTDRSFLHKKDIIEEFTLAIKPRTLWDLGANTGVFTQIVSQHGVDCIAFDIDPRAVELNYQRVKDEKQSNMLPLVMDLTNPSPSLGWDCAERAGLKSRTLPDAVLALALIHHLAISNNVPFTQIARFLSDLSEYLIIEFVPKSDSQVEKLLQSRKDVFVNYDEENFLADFGRYYSIIERKQIHDSGRTIFLMKRK